MMYTIYIYIYFLILPMANILWEKVTHFSLPKAALFSVNKIRIAYMVSTTYYAMLSTILYFPYLGNEN